MAETNTEKKIVLSDNAKKVLDYVRSMRGEKITANDIADGTGLSSRQVNGVVTRAFQERGFMRRVPAEIENPDGTHSAVKFIEETEAGMAFDPDNQ